MRKWEVIYCRALGLRVRQIPFRGSFKLFEKLPAFRAFHGESLRIEVAVFLKNKDFPAIGADHSVIDNTVFVKGFNLGCLNRPLSDLPLYHNYLPYLVPERKVHSGTILDFRLRIFD